MVLLLQWVEKEHIQFTTDQPGAPRHQKLNILSQNNKHTSGVCRQCVMGTVSQLLNPLQQSVFALFYLQLHVRCVSVARYQEVFSTAAFCEVLKAADMK